MIRESAILDEYKMLCSSPSQIPPFRSFRVGLSFSLSDQRQIMDLTFYFASECIRSQHVHRPYVRLIGELLMYLFKTFQLVNMHVWSCVLGSFFFD
jgi:hypothetical protein